VCAIFSKNEKKLNTRYLYYILNAKKDLVLTPLMTGTSNVSMDKNEIHDIEIPLPDLQTQLAIVNKLNKLQDNIIKFNEEINKFEDTINEQSLNIWSN